MNLYVNVDSEFHMSVSVSDFMVRRGNKVRVVYNTHKRKNTLADKKATKGSVRSYFSLMKGLSS